MLENMSRKELQALAKIAGIKANLGNDELRRQLLDLEGIEPCEGVSLPRDREDAADEGSLDMMPRKRLQELAKAAGIKANLPTASLISELKVLAEKEEDVDEEEEQEQEQEQEQMEEEKQEAMEEEVEDHPEVEKEGDDRVDQQDALDSEADVAPESFDVWAKRLSVNSQWAGMSTCISRGSSSRGQSPDGMSPAKSLGRMSNAAEDLEPAAAQEPEAAHGISQLASSILDRVSRMRSLMTKKSPSKGEIPASPVSSRLPHTPPATVAPPHTPSSSFKAAAAGSPSRRASGHTPGLRLSLHETLAGRDSVLTPKRKPCPSPGSRTGSAKRVSHGSRRSIARSSIGSVDEAACLMDEADLDGLNTIAPFEAPKPIIARVMSDCLPRTPVAAPAAAPAPVQKAVSCSAAELMARLSQIKHSFSQVVAHKTPAKNPAKSTAGAATPGRIGVENSPSTAELLMGISDLPITPSNGLLGARYGVRPSLHETLTGGKMTPGRSRALVRTSISGSPLRLVDTNGRSPSEQRSIEASEEHQNVRGASRRQRSIKASHNGCEERRHATVEDKRRECVEGRRAAVAGARGF